MKNQYEIDYQQGYDTANEEWLDRIKQTREEISEMRKKHNVSVTDCLDILDKLIEGEGCE